MLAKERKASGRKNDERAKGTTPVIPYGSPNTPQLPTETSRTVTEALGVLVGFPAILRLFFLLLAMVFRWL
jgi:hypothetical protein